MLDEKICKLRQKLNESIMKGQDYNVTYKLSVELDKLIAQYYKKKLRGINKKIKIQKRR
ncbi:MAG: aspartyl-phosphate phosphatase Spo0E family protein [Clostridia bacterium]|nr:aspartyl-phosphate phosphatase Spo0E family protein [Clostridia bacterium]